MSPGRYSFTYQLRSSRLAGLRSIGSKRGCQSSRKDSEYNRKLVGRRFRTMSADLICAVRPNQKLLAFRSSSQVYMTSLSSLQGGAPTLQLLPRRGRGAFRLYVAHGDVRGWESLGLVARRQSDSVMRFATKRWWRLEGVECKRSGPWLVVARS